MKRMSRHLPGPDAQRRAAQGSEGLVTLRGVRRAPRPRRGRRGRHRGRRPEDSDSPGGHRRSARAKAARATGPSCPAPWPCRRAAAGRHGRCLKPREREPRGNSDRKLVAIARFAATLGSPQGAAGRGRRVWEGRCFPRLPIDRGRRTSSPARRPRAGPGGGHRSGVPGRHAGTCEGRRSPLAVGAPSPGRRRPLLPRRREARERQHELHHLDLV